MIDPLGYTLKCNMLEIDPDEAKLVAFVYSQRELYSINPPAELVEDIYITNHEADTSYTMEMAIEAAKQSSRIDEYIARDVNEQFPEELRRRAKAKLQSPPSYNPGLRKGQIAHHRIEEIIDQATFDKVQEALKNK